ncbi:MAG: GntR family transcriptional regulator [Planctomycetaceae bacterium]|nr:GntR family transcriptional regulator [Planctomycetaceae bacterium]
MPETLAQRAYRTIRHKLEEGAFAPGTRLVNRTLAKEIGISPIPVREALNRLASEGLVSHVSGAGAYVHRPDLHELLELYGMREALEVYAVREAIRNVDEVELDSLRAVCAAHREILEVFIASGRPHGSFDEIRIWMDLEEQFHSRLVAASRNRYVGKTIRNLRLMSRVFGRFRQSCEWLSPLEATRTCDEHEGIVAAVALRDVDLACRLIAEHVGNTRAELLRYFSRPH